MKTLLRKIYYKIRYLPVIGEMAQQFIAFVRNRGYGAARAVDWEQARQVGSLAERLEVVELLAKSQAHAISGLNTACKTLKHDVQSQSSSQLAQCEQTLGQQQSQLEHQGRRIEFVRDEIMFELRKALKLKPVAAPGESAEQSVIEPRILDHVELNNGQPVRLNVGCGHIPHPDKLNVDVRELPGVDIIAGADNLPFEPASVDLIYATHLLEHFPRRYLLDVLLPHWRGLLKAEGTLQLVVPDSEAMLASHNRGEMSFDTLAEVTFGKQDYDGDFHYAMYSPQTLCQLLREAGFKQVEMLVTGRVNGDCREMEVQARNS
ncbi:class I SAM-dependent methyltransferase [Metapseudomonas otitidis]|uniref:class I SAM-dependent methyltransferase n=1 Tax=Metapseudomonas otitidis TaxID=319939 RepID=UPI0040556707